MITTMCNNCGRIIEIEEGTLRCPFCQAKLVNEDDMADEKADWFAFRVISVLVICLLVIPFAITMLKPEWKIKAVLFGVGCLGSIAIIKTDIDDVYEFESDYHFKKFIHVCMFWGIVFALWAVGAGLGWLFSASPGSNLTTEQKINLYTEPEAVGVVGDSKFEIRKSGDTRILVIEKDGEKVYIPVNE